MTVSHPTDVFSRLGGLSLLRSSRDYIEGTFVRTARKPWRCAKCKTAIAPGARYAEYVGEVGPYESGTRYCLSCADRELEP